MSRSNTKSAVISELMVKNVAASVFGDGASLTSQVATGFAKDGEFRGITTPFEYDKWCQSDAQLRGLEEEADGPLLTVCDRNFYMLTYGTIQAEFTGELENLSSIKHVGVGPTLHMCPLCDRGWIQCNQSKCAMAKMGW